MKGQDNSAKADRPHQMAEEARLAAELDMSPRTATPLARNFRAEGLTRVAPPRHACPPESIAQAKAIPGVPRLNDPFRLSLGSGVLTSSIDRLLKSTTCVNRARNSRELLESYMDLAAEASNARQLSALERRVFTEVFGEKYEERTLGAKATDYSDRRCR